MSKITSKIFKVVSSEKFDKACGMIAIGTHITSMVCLNTFIDKSIKSRGGNKFVNTMASTAARVLVSTLWTEKVFKPQLDLYLNAYNPEAGEILDKVYDMKAKNPFEDIDKREEKADMDFNKIEDLFGKSFENTFSDED